MKKKLALIPARGGSKRIPKKNIKLFFDKPIIAYSINTALEAEIFDEIMVSTNTEEIASISQKYGAKIPFLRSSKTTSDRATLVDVVEETLLKYKNLGKYFDYVCCLLPTAPFITSKRLIDGYKLLIRNVVDVVIPVVRFSYPIHRAFKIKNSRLKMIWPKYMHVNSQELLQTYHDSGQFYWLKTEIFLKQKRIFAKNAYPMIISESEVQDIDTEEDWKTAEFKYKMLKLKSK
jgi:N-acylneuraminate cytidylyltransferase